MQSIAGVISQQGFRWNSIFDPDYSGGGHQPLYRDTYATIYDHYAVVSARAKVTYLNSTADELAFVSCVTDDDLSPSGTVDTLAEQSHGYSTIIGSSNGGRPTATFELTWDCKKILRINPYDSQTYKTDFASNPSEQSLLWLSVVALNSGTATVVADVTIEYDVLFTELTTPNSS